MLINSLRFFQRKFDEGGALQATTGNRQQAIKTKTGSFPREMGD